MKQIILAILFAAVAPLHADEIGKILKSKTLGEFVANAAPTLGPKTTEFFKAKIKGEENSPVEVKQTGANEFLFYPSTSPMKMAIDTQSRPMKFTVNGHNFSVPPAMPIEDLYLQVFNAMPKASQASWLSLLPEAHAGNIKNGLIAASGASVMVTALFGVVGNSRVCPKVTSKLEDCMKPKFGYKKEMQEAADVAMDSQGLLMMCPGSSKLIECLQQKAAEKKPKFDDKYLEFFKQTAATTPAEKAADGKTN